MNNNHKLILFGELINIGLFRSTIAETHVHAEETSLVKKLSRLNGLSFREDATRGQKFEVRLEVMGQSSKFQWRFFGVVISDRSSVVVQGYFRLPRFVEVWFMSCLAFVAMIFLVGVWSASASNMHEMWFIPLAAVTICVGVGVVLMIARGMAESAMRRLASRLDQCIMVD